MDIKLSSTICYKDCLFPLNCLGNLVRNQLTLNMGVYLWALISIPLIYVSNLMLILQCFDYCSFLISLKSGNVSPPTFFLQGSPELPYGFLDQLIQGPTHKKLQLFRKACLGFCHCRHTHHLAVLRLDCGPAGLALAQVKGESNVCPQETQEREAVGVWEP